MAKRFGFVTGKWMIAVPWSDADQVWMKLIKGLREGEFSEELGVLFIRVYGRRDPTDFPIVYPGKILRDDANISVFTRDWTNEKTTMKIAEIIRTLEIGCEMKYKPDVYSEFKIDRTNVFKMRPTIYIFNAHGIDGANGNDGIHDDDDDEAEGRPDDDGVDGAGVGDT